MCLNLGVTILASTTEIQLVLSSQCTVGACVYSAKASMYLRITLVFFTALYMHLWIQMVYLDEYVLSRRQQHQVECG